MEKDENSKQKILNAAIKLFAHKGVLRLALSQQMVDF